MPNRQQYNRTYYGVCLHNELARAQYLPFPNTKQQQCECFALKYTEGEPTHPVVGLILRELL